MDVTAINPNVTAAFDLAKMSSKQDLEPEDVKKVANQFESILVRQFLDESMKPLLEDGPSGQVYGYLLTDSLAASVTAGGGVGLSNILQTQLTKKT